MKKHKSGNRFSMQAQGDSAEILIYDDIGASFWGGGVDPKEFSQELKALGDVETLNVHLNSRGGNVFDGVTIYNQLVQHPAAVNVFIDGLAASIASIIAMAGDQISIAENAMIMIHNPWAGMDGNADELRQLAAILDKIKETNISTYAKRTGMKAAKISELMDAETWFTGQEAIDNGFADSLISVKTADTSAKAQFDLSLFKNVPKAAMERFSNQLVAVQASAQEIAPPDFYRERLKLYERAQAR